MNYLDPVWLGGLAGVAVLVAGKAYDWVKDWRQSKSDQKARDQKAKADEEARGREQELAGERQRAEVSIPLNDQAVKVYRDIVEQMRLDMADLVKSIHATDDLLLNCREEKLDLKAKNDAAVAEIGQLRARLTSLEGRVTVQEAKA